MVRSSPDYLQVEQRNLAAWVPNSRPVTELACLRSSKETCGYNDSCSTLFGPPIPKCNAVTTKKKLVFRSPSWETSCYGRVRPKKFSSLRELPIPAGPMFGPWGLCSSPAEPQVDFLFKPHPLKTEQRRVSYELPVLRQTLNYPLPASQTGTRLLPGVRLGTKQ